MPPASMASAVTSGTDQSKVPWVFSTVHHSASIRIQVMPAARIFVISDCCSDGDSAAKWFW